MTNYDGTNSNFASLVNPELSGKGSPIASLGNIDESYPNLNQQMMTFYKTPNSQPSTQSISYPHQQFGDDALQLASPNMNQYNSAVYNNLVDEYLNGGSGASSVTELFDNSGRPGAVANGNSKISSGFDLSRSNSEVNSAGNNNNNVLVKNELELTNSKKLVPQQQKSRPAFVMKLWMMINDESNSEFIQWSPDGKSFKVMNREAFMKNILPKYFKHSNFSSFVRQLNMYGWHKVQDLNAGSINASVNNSGSNDEVWQFESPYFQRGREDLLDKIVRNKSTKQSKVDDTEGLDVNMLVHELNRIKSNQSLIADDLKRVSKDNNLLWQEVFLSRERYNKQNETLNTILRFIATIFQNTSGNPREIEYDNNTNNALMAALYDATKKATESNNMNYLSQLPDYSNNAMSNRNVGYSGTDMNNNADPGLYNDYTDKPRLMIMNDSYNPSRQNSDIPLPYIQSPAGSIRAMNSENNQIQSPKTSINKLSHINSLHGLENDNNLDTLQGEIQRAPENNNDNFIIPQYNRGSPIMLGNGNDSNRLLLPLLNDNTSPRFKELSDSGSQKNKILDGSAIDMPSPLNISLAGSGQSQSVMSTPKMSQTEILQSNINRQEQSINNLADILNRYMPGYDQPSPVSSSVAMGNNDFNVDEFLAGKSTPSVPSTPVLDHPSFMSDLSNNNNNNNNNNNDDADLSANTSKRTLSEIQEHDDEAEMDAKKAKNR